jgi:transposase
LTGGKQRLTATTLHRMLVTEGRQVGVTVVREVVAEWKRRRREVFVPLVYAAGELAQVDFFEVLVDVGGKRRKAHMFVMRMMCSGRDFVCLYERQDQASFLDGHVRAFEHFGAVPQRIAYDNLRAAVTKVLVGAERKLAPRFEALASHYLFEASFCRPRTGHDKGGVEARGKGIRLQHLVPIPAAPTLIDIRRTLLERTDGDHDRERFAAEKAQMLPLPATPFDPRRCSVAVASRSALIKVEGAAYSVWSRWSGLDITVRLGADDVELRGPDGVVVHPRKRFGERSVDYRHYVRELATKPQAVRQVASELIRDLGEPFGTAWRLLVDVHGPREAARVFAKVLGHVEDRGLDAVAARLRDAIARDEPLLLALAPQAAATPNLQHEALPTSLRGIDVQSGSAADYDALLRGDA